MVPIRPNGMRVAMFDGLVFLRVGFRHAEGYSVHQTASIPVRFPEGS
jgi:hypothetical protein